MSMNTESIVTIDFGDESLKYTHPNELALLIEGYSSVLFKIPIPSSRTMLDVSYSYLYASYVLEKLAANFTTKNFTTSSSRHDYFNYDIQVYQYCFDELSPLIVEFLCVLKSNEYIEDDEDFHFIEKVNEFEAGLNSVTLNFPDIIDLYYANMVNGGLDESGNSQEDKYPAHRYGYWHAAKYLSSSTDVLYSENCWIASNDIDIATLFHDENTKDSFSIIPANLLVINSQAMVISENGVLQILMGEVIQGVACIHDTFPDRDGYYPHQLDRFNGAFFSNNTQYSEFNSIDPTNFWLDGTVFELYVSEFGEFVIFKTIEASLVLFNISKPAYSKSQTFINSMLAISASFEDEVLLAHSIELDWHQMDDEKFELLCYDIIYHNSKFDRETIKKMGNSRSRDGGRDIVVHTKEIHNNKAKKFIFQCKFSKTYKSLNTSNIGSVSDVIDQYGAEGYGVMCNYVIDSTLYDRLEGIGKNREIKIETWSGYEIERFIARRPNIKQIHFS
jgi:hypothetical protein